MDEVLSAFLGECHENLEKLDNELVLLEKDPHGPNIQRSLANIFRTVHTIKGSCGWLGLSKLESVVHDGEDLLVCLREGKVEISTEIVTALLEMFDAIREILYEISQTEQEGDKDYSVLIQQLKDLQDPNYKAPKTNKKSKAKKVSKTAKAKKAKVQLETDTAPEEVAEHTVKAENNTNLPNETTPPEEEPEDDDDTEFETDDDITSLSEVLSPAQSSVPGENAPKKDTGAALSANTFNDYIRVDVRVLDKLMNLVGELVLTRNQLLQFTVQQEDNAFNVTSQRLNLITSELQEGVMQTRMQTIGTVWKKYPRLVRDLALEFGKHIRIEMQGEATELDRTIIEAIKDPLTHIVRNAIDHGLESPNDRKASGKPAEGLLKFEAYHEGGQVNIVISDDGRGIDAERIKEKAFEKGVISQKERDTMSDRQALGLIFLPGFSTAQKVTHISGRGVGMDVVKSNIEEIGGSIDLYSEVGQGSSFKIKIPLTLAIIPALIINSGGEDFAIPQMSLLELVALSGHQVADNAIEMIYNTPVYRLRGQLLPLICLNEELQLGTSFENMLKLIREHPDETSLNIIVLQADGQRFGLVVEGIQDTEEIVVKPMSKQLKYLSIYAGATILGDGKVCLILDVMGFAQKVKVLSEVQRRNLLDKEDESKKRISDAQSLLMFKAGSNHTLALPLALVSRLEEIEAARIELSGSMKVLQYRKQILPLIDLTAFFGKELQSQDGDILNIVVITYQGNLAGLIVEQILDIIETDGELEVQYNVRQQGVMGSAILDEQVIEILDLEEILKHKVPSFFETQKRKLIGAI